MTAVAICAKHWILRHYLWVALVLLVFALTASLYLPLSTWQEWIAIVGVPFGFLYAAQKQKTDELTLFAELFTKFNRRYDQLNEKLNAIYDTPSDNPIEKAERNTLFDYFNLCGEEYLFYSQGYVYPEVWKAWFNGMKFFRTNRRIRQLWDDELKTGSYYGLQFPAESDQPNKTQSRK